MDSTITGKINKQVIERIEIRPQGQFLNGVRVYSKREAAKILGCEPLYISRLVDTDKIKEVGYAPYRLGVATVALFVDADSVDAYKLVFRHKDDDMKHQYVIELMPEVLSESVDVLLEVISENQQLKEWHQLDAIAAALKTAEDLTEKRRKYAANRKA